MLGRRSDACSEIYSLVVILYEVCTGAFPWYAEMPLALAESKERKLAVPDLSSSLQERGREGSRYKPIGQ